MRLGRAQKFKPLILKQRIVGTDATIALTGVSATGQVGNVPATITAALTGVSATGQVGNVSLPGGVSLTGVEATGQVGNVTASIQAGLTGVSGTGQTGSSSAVISASISGNTSTGSVGSLTPSVTTALSGASGSGQVGNVGLSGNAVTLPISGVSGTGQVGNVSVQDVSGKVGGDDVPGGGRRHKNPNKGFDLERWKRENQLFDKELERTIAKKWQALTNKDVSEEIKEEAQEIVKPFVRMVQRKNSPPKVVIDWKAAAQAQDFVGQLIDTEDRRIIEEDDDDVAMLLALV